MDVDLCLVASIEFQLVFREAGTLCDLGDRKHRGFLCDLDI